MSSSQKRPAWATSDETAFLAYMASDQDRPVSGMPHSIPVRIKKLETYIEKAKTRRFDSAVDVKVCVNYAKRLLNGLKK